MQYAAIILSLLGILLLLAGAMSDFLAESPAAKHVAHKLIVWGMFAFMFAVASGLMFLATV